MLRFLRVTHLAVLDSVEVEFAPGLNVLTGETGAGKSILVGAVGLLLGGRASGDLVRTGEELATIEAIFENDGEEWLVRREITAQGRSRAFVNGTLATAGALKDLSGRLIELHGQHEHQTLLDPATHLGVIDAFGGLDAAAAATARAFDALRTARDEVARLRAAASDSDSRVEFITFQLGELERAALTPGEPGEDVELKSLREVLANAERVERLCVEGYTALYDRDDALLAGLGQVWRRVSELASLDPRFQPYLDARDGIKSQLEDLAGFLRRYANGIQASPARLQQVDERLALLERLKRKYGPTLQDVVARRDALAAERTDLERGDGRLVELERDVATTRAAYLAAAEALSRQRRRAAVAFSSALIRVLRDLALDQTRFEVRFNDAPPPEAGWTSTGLDQAEFFFSPNPGEDLRPLVRIVSGGELSRLMLAMKTLTAPRRRGFSDATDRRASASAPGLIFDEVDAGIGGRVADVVGRNLRTLGSAFQVLCITHLPQIAVYADTQFQIEKRVEGGRTKASVRQLTVEARVDEIARMLGGEAVTDGLRRSAHEMLVGRAVTAPDRGPGELTTKGESERAKAKGRRRASKTPDGGGT